MEYSHNRNKVKGVFPIIVGWRAGQYPLHMRRTPRSARPPSEGEAALENWLRTEGVARYDAFKRDPRRQSAKNVFARLRQHHAKRTKSAAR